jgi:hypothetical protein
MAAKVKKETSHNVEFAKGGKDHMFPEQAADRQEPGHTADQTATDNKGQKYAEGGKGKMFGYAGSQPAPAGKTSAR